MVKNDRFLLQCRERINKKDKARSRRGGWIGQSGSPWGREGARGIWSRKKSWRVIIVNEALSFYNFLIASSMAGKRKNSKKGVQQGNKKKYDFISYYKRLKLIEMVYGKNLSSTSACDGLEIKLTTGCLILRTFINENRIMKKRGLPLSPEEELRQQLEIPELEAKARIFREQQLNPDLIKREELNNRPEQLPTGTRPFDKHPQSEEDPEVKEQPDDKAEYVKFGAEDEAVKNEEEIQDYGKEEPEAEPAGEEFPISWIFPTFPYFEWPTFPK